jgi:LCP family protein required for cell wall assembly
MANGVSTTPATTPATPPGRDGRRLRVLLALTATVALLVGLVGGLGFGSLVWAQHKLNEHDVESRQDPETGEKIIGGPCVRRACNYLLLGSDSRTGLSHEDQVISGTNADLGGEQRADTIMLIHVDPDREQAVILSFPRDLWVPVPGHGMDKINSAFEGGVRGGGADLVARTVEDLTGLHINHFLYVDLAGFQGVVDALGGVRMCVPYPMQDVLTGLDVQAGCQEFDGGTALAFVRTRHQPCDAVPDFARIGRQQQFLRAVLTKLLSPSEVANLPGLVKPVASNVVKDSDFQILDIIELARQLQGVSTGAADFRAVPGQPELITPPEFPSGISVVSVTPQARELFRDLREGRSLGDVGHELAQTAISEANIEAAVYDKNSDGGAHAVEKVLAEAGFNVAPGILPADELAADVKGSAILYGPGDEARAAVVAKYFSNLKMVEVDGGVLPGGAVAVHVTSGYRPAPVGTGGATAAPDCTAGVEQPVP